MSAILNSILHLIGIYLFKQMGLYSLLYVVISAFFKNPIVKRADQEATGFMAFAGLVYAITFLLAVILALINPENEEVRYQVLNRIFGPYWFGFWLQPMLWIAITQLLRIKKIAKNALIRIVFGIIFIISIEVFVIITTSIRMNEHLPFGWADIASIMPPALYILAIFLNILFFLLFVGIYYGAKLGIKRLRQSVLA